MALIYGSTLPWNPPRAKGTFRAANHASADDMHPLSLSRLPHLEMCISTCQIMACALNRNLRERSNYIIRKTERNGDKLPNRATHQPTSNQAKHNINQQSLHTLTKTCRNNEPNEDELPIQATQTTSTALHPKYEWPPPHKIGHWLLRFRGYNDTAIPPKPKPSHIRPRHLPSRLRHRRRPLRHGFLSSLEKWRRWSGGFQTKWKSKEKTQVGFVDSDTHQPQKTRRKIRRERERPLRLTKWMHTSDSPKSVCAPITKQLAVK
jgi:hypothetical protein